jgi:hypothetical protein
MAAMSGLNQKAVWVSKQVFPWQMFVFTNLVIF